MKSLLGSKTSIRRVAYSQLKMFLQNSYSMCFLVLAFVVPKVHILVMGHVFLVPVLIFTSLLQIFRRLLAGCRRKEIPYFTGNSAKHSASETGMALVVPGEMNTVFFIVSKPSLSPFYSIIQHAEETHKILS